MLVTKTNKCKTCLKAAKNSREVTGTPDGQEQTNAKDPEKPSKIDRGGDGSREQQTSTTLKLFWLGEAEGVRTLTNVAGILGMLTVRIFGQFLTDFHFNFCSILPPT